MNSRISFNNLNTLFYSSTLVIRRSFNWSPFASKIKNTLCFFHLYRYKMHMACLKTCASHVDQPEEMAHRKAEFISKVQSKVRAHLTVGL